MGIPSRCRIASDAAQSLRTRHRRALSQGVSLEALQTILGHSDASLTLNRYSHLISSDGQVAAEKMADLLLREEPMTRIGHSELVPPVIVEVA